MLVFSDACWPVRVSKLSGVSTPEDAQRMEVYAEGLMTRARREGVLCVQVVDTRAEEKVDATTRAAFADLEKRRGNEFNTCLAGTVVIIKSAVVRGALTARHGQSLSPALEQQLLIEIDRSEAA